MSLIDNNGGTIKVRRDNVILRVPVEQKSYYMGLGYNVINEAGKVIEETVPTDVATLQRFYKDAKKKIAELEEEIKSLKAQKPEKKKESKPVVEQPIELVIDQQPVAEKVTVSSRRRKSNK